MITMHPGEYLSLSYVEPYKISSVELSERLGLPVQTIDGLLMQEIELTAEMAVRFELALGRSAESWLGMQTDHSLMQARKKVVPATVRPFVFPPRKDAA
ncbi:HigA family addiction module antidote protein [Duganella sp. FT134W]|uniref:HigA family addiction module antidote protein n=1 Tax=Duganella margarita TaxID=2692170 RepID=A0A7X4GX42_9BURK|nr:HigA family addiction module antitoxin [Duganella margarita]MYM71261.1 HigA family addiction module antidote protein [Duganella margarita]